MKLADSNVWLALSLSGHEHHSTVSAWFRQQTAEGSIVFCRSTQLSTLRLLTTRAIVSPYGNPPLTNQDAWQLYGALIADPRVGFAVEPWDVENHWKRLAAVPSPSQKLWMDAYLAAFAIAGRHQLVTIDEAFKQFAGLDLILLPKA